MSTLSLSCGNHDQLILGDCLIEMAKLEAESINLIFADPPYNLSNGGFTCHAGKAVSVDKGKWDKSEGIDKDFEFVIRWLEECKRLLKPNGTIWISGTYHSIYQSGYALQKLNYHILNDICWFKPNASPNLSCRYFTASHETLIWAGKKKSSGHTFNYQTMKNGRFPKDFIKKPGKQMRSLWAIGTPQAKEKMFGKHPTQKPLDLLERIILAASNKGEVILDPFMGSGTTGIAALRHGREFIGIELDKEYYKLAGARILDEIKDNPLPLFEDETWKEPKLSQDLRS